MYSFTIRECEQHVWDFVASYKARKFFEAGPDDECYLVVTMGCHYDGKITANVDGVSTIVGQFLHDGTNVICQYAEIGYSPLDPLVDRLWATIYADARKDIDSRATKHAEGISQTVGRLTGAIKLSWLERIKAKF